MSHTDTEQNVCVAKVKKGEFVRRTKKDGTPMDKVFIRDDFERSVGKYRLIDAEDVNREVFVSKDAIVFVGFSY